MILLRISGERTTCQSNKKILTLFGHWPEEYLSYCDGMLMFIEMLTSKLHIFGLIAKLLYSHKMNVARSIFHANANYAKTEQNPKRFKTFSIRMTNRFGESYFLSVNLIEY